MLVDVLVDDDSAAPRTYQVSIRYRSAGGCDGECKTKWDPMYLHANLRDTLALMCENNLGFIAKIKSL